jgi:hypothetical protein
VLRVTLVWAPALESEQGVRDLVDDWFGALRGIVAHAARPHAGGLTASDLTLALDQGEIDELEAELRAEQ